MGRVPRCTLILVEDDREVREDLTRGLKTDYGHKVIAFRDLVTLKEADGNGVVLGRMQKDLPLVAILDIMLARELDANASSAPRWLGRGRPPVPDHDRYLDDELGLAIGRTIRDGGFQTIAADTPILFFTARENEEVLRQIEEMGRAKWLPKPAFVDDVQQALEGLFLGPMRESW